MTTNPATHLFDENLEDMTGLELVKKMVSVNPMLNFSAISSLFKDGFHEESDELQSIIMYS